MRQLQRRYLALPFIALLLFVNAAFIGNCNKQPQTVANALHSLGNIKRGAKAQGEITPQQDLDISRKLDAMNRSYKQFVVDEQARLAAGTTDPTAKTRALSELRSLLNGLTDPAVLGFKSVSAQAAWSASIGTLNTILAGLGG